MSKKDYLDPKWQKKRLEILERDGFKCTECMDGTKTLHVHHTYYDNHLEYWGYSNDSYITLCDDCHKSKHEDIETVNPMKIKRLSDLLTEHYDFSCDKRLFMQDCTAYGGLVLEYLSSGEGYLLFSFDEDETESDLAINNFLILQALLFYKVRVRNIRKIVSYWMCFGNIQPPKEVGVELLHMSRDMNRSFFK